MENEVKNPEIFNEENELIDEKLKAEIEKKLKDLREKTKVKRIFPIVVAGDEFDEKEYYVGYFKQPDFVVFSKYLSLSAKQDPSIALRQLAKDCFVEGDRELVDDDSLFIYGSMPHISSIINTRRGNLVNFSKTGK